MFCKELYQADCESAKYSIEGDTVVSRIDFAQNVALPHSAKTPMELLVWFV